MVCTRMENNKQKKSVIMGFAIFIVSFLCFFILGMVGVALFQYPSNEPVSNSFAVIAFTVPLVISVIFTISQENYSGVLLSLLAFFVSTVLLFIIFLVFTFLVAKDPYKVPDKVFVVWYSFAILLATFPALTIYNKKQKDAKATNIANQGYANIPTQSIPRRYQDYIPVEPLQYNAQEQVRQCQSRTGMCPSCGKMILRSYRFCSECGQPTNFPAEPAPEPYHYRPSPVEYIQQEATQPVVERPAPRNQERKVRRCPSCQSTNIQYQTVTEARGTGCMTVFLYVLLALTILGLLIVIPLMLRKKTNTVTYAICQDCGKRWPV